MIKTVINILLNNIVVRFVNRVSSTCWSYNGN